MTPEQRRLVHRIAEDAAGLDGVELAAFLQERCAGASPEVRDSVECLLRQNSARFPASAARPAGPDSADDFELLERIGAGASADVYKARQRSLDRLVALKVFRDPLTHNATSIERFRLEAMLAAQVSHSAIVPVYETGQIDRRPFIAYALIEGQTLADFAGERPVEPRKAAQIACKLAEAVAYAHRKGIIHRDLKPANVLMDSQHQVLITDFGLARLLDRQSELTQTGQIVGTPSYMSPEQVEPEFGPIGKPSDIYSLGAILYRLIAGRPPVSGVTVQQTLRDIVEEAPVPLCSVIRGLDPDLETIVKTCLAKEPGHRYATAELLVEDLTAYLDGRPIQARPVGMLIRTLRWCRRNRVLAGLIGALLVAVPAMLLFGLLALNRANEAIQARATAGEHLKTAERAGREARHTAYISRMVAAQQALELKQTERCRRLLISLIPSPGEEDFRGFDWRCLWSLVHGELTAFQRHPGIVTDLQFSADGDTLATTGVDNCIRFWDRKSGKLTGTIEQPATDHSCLAFIPGTDRIASNNGFTVRIWDSDTHALLAELDGHTGRLMAMDVSPDGSRLATASGAGDQRVGIWDLTTNEVIAFLEGHSGPVRDVAFSPDGCLLASCGNDRTIRIWDVESRQTIHAFSSHEWVVHAVEFSPDGQYLASGSWDQTVRLWKTSDWSESAVLRQHQGIVRCVSFSPDGSLLASGSEDRTVRLWSIPDGKLVDHYEQHPGMIWALDFSPDGNLIASGGETSALPDDPSTHGEGGIISLRNVNEAAEYHPDRTWDERATVAVKTPGWVNDLAFTADGQALLAADDAGCVTRLAVRTGETEDVIARLSEPVLSLAVAPNNDVLATCGGKDGIRIQNLSGADAATSTGGHLIRSLDVSRDGQWLAAGGDDEVLRLWDLSRRECVTESFVGEGAILCVRLSPDGQRIACACSSGPVVIWNLGENRRDAVLPHDTAFVSAIAFSLDGEMLLTGCQDTVGRIWNVRTGRLLNELRGHHQEVVAVEFSPDSRTAVTGSHDSSTRFWDIETAEEVLVLRGLPDEVQTLKFSPDGNRLVIGRRGWSSSRKGNLDVWMAATDREVVADLQAAVTANASDVDSKLALAKVAWRQFASEADTSPDKAHWMTLVESLLIEVESDSNAQPAIRGLVNRLQRAVHDEPHKAPALKPGTAMSADGIHKSLLELADYYYQSAGTGPFRAGRLRLRSIERLNRAIRIAESLCTHADARGRLDDYQARLRTIESVPGLVHEFEGHGQWATDIAFSVVKNALWSVSYDGTLRQWDYLTGEQTRRIDTGSRLNGLAVSPTGRLIATASADDFRINIWNAESGQRVQTLDGHADVLFDMRFSQDENTLISAGRDRRLRFWNLHSEESSAHQFGSPNWWQPVFLCHVPGRPEIAAVSVDGLVEFWSCEKRRNTDAFQLQLPAKISSLDSSDDTGNFLIGLRDGTVTLAAASLAVPPVAIGRHDESVMCVRLSPNGRWAASVGQDLTLRVWDIKRRLELVQFTGRSGRSVEFSPDGRYLAMIDEGPNITLWRLPPPEENSARSNGL